MSDASRLIKLVTNGDIVTHLRGIAAAHALPFVNSINAGLPDLVSPDKSSIMPLALPAMFVYAGDNHEVDVNGQNGRAITQTYTNRINVMVKVKNSDATSYGATADFECYAIRQFLTAAMMMYDATAAGKNGGIFRYIGDTLFSSERGLITRIYHFEQLVQSDYSDIYYADDAFVALKEIYGSITQAGTTTPFQQKDLDT